MKVLNPVEGKWRVVTPLSFIPTGNQENLGEMRVSSTRETKNPNGENDEIFFDDRFSWSTILVLVA
jgi:hypothetical protein